MKEIAQSSKILGEIACFLNFLGGGAKKFQSGNSCIADPESNYSVWPYIYTPPPCDRDPL